MQLDRICSLKGNSTSIFLLYTIIKNILKWIRVPFLHPRFSPDWSRYWWSLKCWIRNSPTEQNRKSHWFKWSSAMFFDSLVVFWPLPVQSIYSISTENRELTSSWDNCSCHICNLSVLGVRVLYRLHSNCTVGQYASIGYCRKTVCELIRETPAFDRRTDAMT